MSIPTSNADETLQPENQPDALFIGNFHKTLPHNDYGEVVPAAYQTFRQTCLDVEAGEPVDFENVPRGYDYPFPAFEKCADSKATAAGAGFTSPLAGAASEVHGPDPKVMEMPPAPGIRSLSTAAEMVELYWMALLRDVPLASFAEEALVNDAVTDVKASFDQALAEDRSSGRLRLGLDLPQRPEGMLDIRPETLFRCGLQDEEYGPLVSQFFLQDIPYGVQTIKQCQTPYLMNKNFLTTREDWLRAQTTGKDKWGRDYGTCNSFADQQNGREQYYPEPDVKRHISTIRDLARFVNRDALHQAYFNAALFLDAIGAPVDDGNPYVRRYTREGGFATLGGPDLLTLVSEVASRALKVVWRQKWLVHRRARPEVYGGLLQMQFNGWNCVRREYGLPDLAKNSQAGALLSDVKKSNPVATGTYFLPMAFSAGSPAHPAYGAGHATVAGACVTVLKAWFDETRKLKDLLPNEMNPKDGRERPTIRGVLQPGRHKTGEEFESPTVYDGADAGDMTVGGELNKIASNVATGRSMGGVHWRTDNTRSLRLGEKIAIEILRKRTLEYAEEPVSFTFRAFDRHTVRIAQGQVTEY